MIVEEVEVGAVEVAGDGAGVGGALAGEVGDALVVLGLRTFIIIVWFRRIVLPNKPAYL